MNQTSTTPRVKITYEWIQRLRSANACSRYRQASSLTHYPYPTRSQTLSSGYTRREQQETEGTILIASACRSISNPEPICNKKSNTVRSHMTNLHKTVSVLTKLITVATNSDVYRLTSGRVPMVCCYASVVNLFLIANPFPTSRNSQPPASFVVWFVGPSTALGLLFATHRSLHLEVGNGRRTSGEPGKLPLVVMRLHVVAVPINGCGSWTNTLMERPFLRLANNPTTRRCLSRSERRGRKHQLIWADDHYSQPEALR